jgi:hypothetical protein
MSDEDTSPKPFSPTDAPSESPRPASQVVSTVPEENAVMPGAAPLPPAQLKIHDYQYSEEPMLRPINIQPAAPDEDEEEADNRPMFDGEGAPANWPIWIGALLLMSFFIAAAVWMLYKARS